jgi:hypothetical protein
MKTHELKIKPEYFLPVFDRRKNFELRKNDRDFQVGDIIVFREFENGEYVDGFFAREITYVLKDCPEYGLQDGYCILGLE